VATTNNVLQLSGAGNSAELVFDGAPEGQFDGYRLNISGTVTVTGTPTGAAADLKAYLQRAIGQLIEEYGPTGARKTSLYNIDGLDLRTLHRLALRNEVQNNVIGTVYAAGDVTFSATIFRPFAMPWLRGQRKRPGHTQMRSFKLKIVEGSGNLTAGYVRKAGTFITIEVEFCNRPGRDQLAPVLSISRENSPRRDLIGPDGVTLAAWIPGTAAAASALTAFTVDIGARRVHQLQSVQSITKAFADDHIDQGGTNITDEHTLIHYAGDLEVLEELPHGPMKFEEAKSDLSPIDMRILYYPPITELEAKRWAVHAAGRYGRPVLLTQMEPSLDQDPGAASVAVAHIVRTDDARFALEPGVIAGPGSDAADVSIPRHYLANAKAARSGVGRAAVGDQAVRRLEKITSLRVPGATDSRGEGSGTIREAIRAKFDAAA
jgi:hypothetical protein